MYGEQETLQRRGKRNGMHRRAVLGIASYERKEGGIQFTNAEITAKHVSIIFTNSIDTKKF